EPTTWASSPNQSLASRCHVSASEWPAVTTAATGTLAGQQWPTTVNGGQRWWATGQPPLNHYSSGVGPPQLRRRITAGPSHLRHRTAGQPPVTRR
ncbi:hypothetical protein Tco_0175889, partial [Tanacetum coccineum]